MLHGEQECAVVLADGHPGERPVHAGEGGRQRLQCDNIQGGLHQAGEAVRISALQERIWDTPHNSPHDVQARFLCIAYMAAAYTKQVR